jgi:hypothetical protein
LSSGVYDGSEVNRRLRGPACPLSATLDVGQMPYLSDGAANAVKSVRLPLTRLRPQWPS